MRQAPHPHGLRVWRAEVDILPRDPDSGAVLITEENRVLFVPGDPLPNGQYLHH
jgi:hypothetical protein